MLVRAVCCRPCSSRGYPTRAPRPAALWSLDCHCMRCVVSLCPRPDSLSSSLESVHLSSAPMLSPTMMRRLGHRRSVEARTPSPTDKMRSEVGARDRLAQLRDSDEGLEGLGVTVNSPVSETAFRARPSASARRSQIAKCKALR